MACLTTRRVSFILHRVTETKHEQAHKSSLNEPSAGAPHVRHVHLRWALSRQPSRPRFGPYAGNTPTNAPSCYSPAARFELQELQLSYISGVTINMALYSASERELKFGNLGHDLLITQPSVGQTRAVLTTKDGEVVGTFSGTLGPVGSSGSTWKTPEGLTGMYYSQQHYSHHRTENTTARTRIMLMTPSGRPDNIGYLDGLLDTLALAEVRTLILKNIEDAPESFRFLTNDAQAPSPVQLKHEENIFLGECLRYEGGKQLWIHPHAKH